VADFSDAVVTDSIELFPVIDADGNATDSDDWTPTYDLYRAAADIVQQRAAQLAERYDVNTDGASMTRSQMQAHLSALSSRLLCRAKVRVTNPTFDDEEDTEDDD
jgi:hypothetical protein